MPNNDSPRKLQRIRRRDMRPGDIFAYPVSSYGPVPVLLVVLNPGNEVGFWCGGWWVIGQVLPETEFEVMS